jgi:hypothetical protein
MLTYYNLTLNNSNNLKIHNTDYRIKGLHGWRYQVHSTDYRIKGFHRGATIRDIRQSASSAIQTRGSVIMNSEPSPSFVITFNSPLWALTIS